MSCNLLKDDDLITKEDEQQVIHFANSVLTVCEKMFAESEHGLYFTRVYRETTKAPGDETIKKHYLIFDQQDETAESRVVVDDTPLFKRYKAHVVMFQSGDIDNTEWRSRVAETAKIVAECVNQDCGVGSTVKYFAHAHITEKFSCDGKFKAVFGIKYQEVNSLFLN